MNKEYVTISIFSLLSGSTYIKLPNKLRNSMKSLINIKNNDDKLFLWCHIRYLNPINIHLKKIAKADRKIVDDLDYRSIEFPVCKKNYSKTEQKNKICINFSYYENDLTYPVYVSNETFENCMDLLLITDENKSHYVYISKILIDLFVIRQKIIIISVKLRSGSIKLKNYFKQ